MSEPVFDLQRVTFNYDEVKALDGLSLTVEQGTRIALLGANGSGKSTLLRLLDGLAFPHEGTVYAFGEPLTEQSLERPESAFRFHQRVGLIFQNPDVQLFNPTVFDEVAFGPLQLRWSTNLIRERVEEVLSRMEITHLRDRSPHRLSTGEKKRVALASVLILDPAVLLLDEPTAALDPKSKSQVIDLLISWGGGLKTVVTATHDLDTIGDIADHCFVFQSGRLEVQGAPNEILRDEQMLLRTGLIHSHRHVHASGEAHSHPHLHGHHEH